MKKRILSLLLVLILLVTVSAFAVEATEPAATSFVEDVDGDGAADATVQYPCEHCNGATATWTKATDSTIEALAEAGGHVYVPSAGVALNGSGSTGHIVLSNVKLCLYLNGDLTRNMSSVTGSNRYMIRLYYSDNTTQANVETELNLMGTGALRATSAAYYKINGTIINTSTASVADGYTCTHTINIYDGVTVDGTGVAIQATHASATVDTGKGAAIYLGSSKAALNIKGGTIKGGTSPYGGAIYVDNATVTMTGGTIEGGTARENTKVTIDDGYGGAVYMTGTSGTFTMSGGAIEGGTAVLGGAVYVDGKAQFNMNGGSITGGDASYGGVVYLKENSQFNMTAGTVSGGTATDGATIYSTNSALTMSGGTITGSTATNGGAVYLTGGAASFGMTGGTITGGNATNGGNIYMTTSATFNMSAGTITGGVATQKGGNVYVGGGTFTLSGTGEVVLGDANHGGNFCLDGVYTDASTNKPAKLTVSGGTIAAGSATQTGSSKTAHFGGNVALMVNGRLTMTGGTMNNQYTDAEGTYTGTATHGVNIGVYADTAIADQISLSGGAQILGGTAAGDAIHVGNAGACNVTIDNCTVHNDQRTNDFYFNNSANGKTKLTVSSGFTGDVTVYYRANLTLATDGVVNSELAVANGYTNGGNVIIDYADDLYPVTGSGTSFVFPAAIIYDGRNIVSTPASAQAAVDSTMAAGQYVKLLQPGAAITLTKNTYVDFNGNDATVTGGQYLLGMDSQTNNYTNKAGAITLDTAPTTIDNVVAMTINGVAGTRRYLAMQDATSGAWSFHRYYVSMDKYGLRTDSSDGTQGPGIIYSGVYRGDPILAKAVTAFGIEFTVNGNTIKYSYMDAEFGGLSFNSVVRNEGAFLAIHGLMHPTYGETDITARAYMIVNGQTVYGDIWTTNLRSLVEGYVADYSNLNTAWQTSVAAMVEKYGAYMKNTLNWSVDLPA